MSGMLECQACEQPVSKAALLKAKLAQLSQGLREAVDLTLEVRRESPQHKGITIQMWEEFLSQFFGYIKQKSKEHKDNLLAGISITRLKIF